MVSATPMRHRLYGIVRDHIDLQPVMKSAGSIVIAVSIFASIITSTYAKSVIDTSVPDGNWLATALDLISTERMLSDITVLSGPAFRGRLAGSRQDEESAEFIANRFGALRLQRSPSPAPHSRTNPLPQREWKQTSSLPMTTISTETSLTLLLPNTQRPLEEGGEFLPILDSPSAEVRAPIVFVGYGLSDPPRGIDDYAGIDVQNKIVLFLRGKPDAYNGPATHADKERIARQHGAIAYLTATGPILTEYEQRRGVTGTPSAFYSSLTESSPQLPGAWISTTTAEVILNADGGTTTLRIMQEKMSRKGSPQSRETRASADMRWTSRTTTGTLFNVISVIRGYSPETDQAVLIGAHRDHFGEQAGLLFAGADDNASGTAVLLEVARVMALAPAAPKHSVLFISFSGEERGLLGSRLYVSQPIVPLEKTIAMINVDHAGVGNGRLTVGVTGFEKALARDFGQLAGLSERVDVFGFFPGGDHVPFKESGVPTITVVSGGVHPHFHQPTDTADTINPEILRSVARYVFTVAWQLANQP